MNMEDDYSLIKRSGSAQIRRIKKQNVRIIKAENSMQNVDERKDLFKFAITRIKAEDKVKSVNKLCKGNKRKKKHQIIDLITQKYTTTNKDPSIKLDDAQKSNKEFINSQTMSRTREYQGHDKNMLTIINSLLNSSQSSIDASKCKEQSNSIPAIKKTHNSTTELFNNPLKKLVKYKSFCSNSLAKALTKLRFKHYCKTRMSLGNLPAIKRKSRLVSLPLTHSQEAPESKSVIYGLKVTKCKKARHSQVIIV